MKTISVSIGEGRTDLCKLLKKVESGALVVLTDHGKPKAVISKYHKGGAPWRAAKPGDPKQYGDLDSPVMEPWK